MSANRVQARNLVLNWGSHAATLVVMFFLSPYVVGQLDKAAYGIWTLLNVFTGYMGVFDLGVRASVGRHIALYLGRRDEKGVDETIRAGLGFFSVAGGAIVLVGVALGWLFPHMFGSVPEQHFGTVRALLPLMVVNVWLSAVAAIYSSVLNAHDRFDLSRSVDLAVLAVRTAGTVGALKWGMGLWGLAGSVLASNAVAVVGNFVLAHRQHRGLRSWPFLYSRERLREITGYGVMAFLSRASLKVIGQTDLVIAGAVFTVAAVREYSVGATLVYYSSTFVGIIDNTLFPALQRAAGRGDGDTVRWLFVRQLRIAMLFGVPAYVGMALFARPFIRLWMLQPGFPEASVSVSAGVMAVLAMAKLPLVFVSGSASVLAATGRIRVSAALTVGEALLNVALSLAFSVWMGWGLYGIAAGTLVATLLVRGTWVPVIAAREAKVPVARLLMDLVAPLAVAVVAFGGISLLTLRLTAPSTWGRFGAAVAAALAAYAVLVVPLLLPAEHRRRLILKGRSILQGRA